MVMVSFLSSAEDADGTRVIALDAMTGAPGFDDVTDGGVFGGVRLAMTDHVLLGGNRDDGHFFGRDLRTGERRWEYRKPDNCRWSTLSSDPVLGRDVVVFGLVCGPREPTGPTVSVTVSLFALDDRTGEERWRFERRVPALAMETGDAGWTQPGWNIDQYTKISADGAAIGAGWADSETGSSAASSSTRPPARSSSMTARCRRESRSWPSAGTGCSPARRAREMPRRAR